VSRDVYGCPKVPTTGATFLTLSDGQRRASLFIRTDLSPWQPVLRANSPEAKARMPDGGAHNSLPEHRLLLLNALWPTDLVTVYLD
jgi:hypothetical protein